jgi:hypothetical protein
MIFTKNSNGSYTIDLDTAIKIPYTTSTDIYLNGTVVANTLPAVVSGIAGVQKIRIHLVGPTGTYDESKCALIDSTMECQIFTKLGAMTEKERLASNLPYLWFLVKEGSDDQACSCVCDSIKTIYTDLFNQVNNDCCC